MAEIEAQLPPALVTQIKQLINPDIAEMKGWGHNKVNAAKEAGIKMQSEEAQAEAAEEFYTVFGDSDKDCDGLLNCEEWIAFSKKYSELKAQRDEPETYQDDNTREKWYKVMN